MIDFPANPVFGDEFVITGITYVWNGQGWAIKPIDISNSSALYVSDTPPVDPPDNAIWWESDSGMLFIRFNDGTSSQWVEAIAGPGTGSVRFDSQQALTEAQKSQAYANIGWPPKNYVINGCFQLSQENVNTAGTAIGYYAADMWAQFHSHSGTQTVQRVTKTTPAGATYRLRVTATVADATVDAGNYSLVFTRFEGLRIADLLSGTALSKTVTLQFGVSAPAGTYCVAVRNAALNRSYTTEYVIAAGEANTDVIKSVTFRLDQTGTWQADNTLSMDISWCLMVGTNLQAPVNAWSAGNFLGTASQFNFMGTANNVFELFDVSLTVGTVAPPCQVQHGDYVMRECQRYWQDHNPYLADDSVLLESFLLPVAMRAAPTAAFVSVNYSNCTGLTLHNSSPTHFSASATVTVQQNSAWVAFIARLSARM